MAGMYFAKKMTSNVSKTSPKIFRAGFQSATRLSTTSGGSSSMNEAKQQALDVDEGRANEPVSGYGADIVKESGTVEDNDDHIDKDPVVGEMKNTDDPVDTQEYRIIEEQQSMKNQT